MSHSLSATAYKLL